MADIEKYSEITRVFPYDYTDDGKVLGDIVELVYMLQIEPSDADDKYLFKRQSQPEDQLTFDDGAKEVSVFIKESDFNPLLVGESYKEIFGVKYIGDTRFRSKPIILAPETEISELNIIDNWFERTE